MNPLDHRNGNARPSVISSEGMDWDKRPVLITGGCGFIGTNLAHYLLSQGQRVRILDNLSRSGVERNLKWLNQTHRELLEVEVADVRDLSAVRRAAREVSKVFHFAAQVAVTTSLINPIDDFEINARGTLNLLETIRRLRVLPPLVYTSSNKVYGNLADVTISEESTRYEPVGTELREHGFCENRPLHFHSPYGCSKGAASQYVLDYARTFGIPAVVFHMSCIYGEHQFGNEDQGWVAHFLIRVMEDLPLTIYGNGKQVRDILFVEDLVNALLLANLHIDRISGEAFNIGGGPQNTISLLELLDFIKQLHGKLPPVYFKEWRAADQPYYVSDIHKFAFATNWAPIISAEEGIKRLWDWLSKTRTLSSSVPNEFTRNENSTTAPRLVAGTDFANEPRSKRIRKNAWQKDAHPIANR